MEVEKYMIHVGDVLEDPDMCFAHLLEGKEKKLTSFAPLITAYNSCQ